MNKAIVIHSGGYVECVDNKEGLNVFESLVEIKERAVTERKWTGNPNVMLIFSDGSIKCSKVYSSAKPSVYLKEVEQH